MILANQRMGQGIARDRLQQLKEEQKTKRAVALEEVKGRVYMQKQLAKARAKDVAKNKARLEKFGNKVASQNVQGTIPTVESRGVHNMVVFNPFSSPEKTTTRDPKTGLLHVDNSIWG